MVNAYPSACRRAAASADGFVVVNLDGDRRNEIEIRQRASGALGAFAQRTQKHFGGFGNERVAEPAVGHLTGESQVAWPHRRHVDRHVPWSHLRSQRSATAVRQRKRVDLAGMIEPVSAADDPDDLDGFPGRLHRLAEPDTVPALHHSGPRRADTKQESAVRQLLQAQRGRREQRGTARTKLHHKRSQLDR